MCVGLNYQHHAEEAKVSTSVSRLKKKKDPPSRVKTKLTQLVPSSKSPAIP
jgi:hypothetical protein